MLVVTEGTETEPQYVERLDAFLRSSEFTTHVKRVGVGKDPLRVVEKCVELRDKADSVTSHTTSASAWWTLISTPLSKRHVVLPETRASWC